MIEPAVLEKVLFPIAAHTVDQIRARVAGLPLANMAESQDVCFLQEQSLVSYLSSRIPECFVAGDILDVGGRVIGRHGGAAHFTTGQRRGTRSASDRKRYVVSRDLAANTVTLGDEKNLLSASLAVGRPVFWRPLRPRRDVGGEGALPACTATRPRSSRPRRPASAPFSKSRCAP